MALTMYGTSASAKHHKKHKTDDTEAAASPSKDAKDQKDQKDQAATTTTTTTTSAAASPDPTPPAAAATPAASTPAEQTPLAATSPAPGSATDAVPPTTTATPAPAAPRNGVRFRGGVSLIGGGEFVSGFTAGLGGIDGRIGVQINNLVGIYAQPHLSFGAGTIGNISGATGTVAATLMVDFTIIHRIYAGIGGGYGVVNNPNGPVLQISLGGYPVMRWSDTKARRKALQVGLDNRNYFTPVGPVVQIMGSVGYEAY